jgi:phage replication-related protein YjqB (UPF0714/DUF867 family)
MTSGGFFGDSELMKDEISLYGLNEHNEITKRVNKNNIKFEVTVRVRQAYSKKELEVKETKNLIIK